MQSYFREKFYMFLPNVCNAKCAFCHVQPAFARHATLPTAVLRGSEAVFKNARSEGFREVKFTGGEPLLFENATTLFDLAGEAGLEYSVLTNGLYLETFLQYFRGHRPRQLMVSIHSGFESSNSATFGIKRPDTERVMQMLADLTDAGLKITVTSVLQECDVSGVIALHQRLHPLIECKLLRATDVGAHETVSPESFEAASAAVVAAAGSRRLRVSDTAERFCQLRSRGFLSLLLPSFNYTACCAAFQTSAARLDPREPGDFKAILRECRREGGGSLSAAPCGTSSAHCPLALRPGVGRSVPKMVPSGA